MVPPEDDPAGKPSPGKASQRQTAPGQTAPASDSAEAVVVVTLRVTDGSTLKIEAVAPGGARHELTTEEAGKLLGGRSKATVRGLVHEAFEAGIACILDDSHTSAADDANESQADVILHDELLDALIEHSPAKRLLRRDVLNSALLGSIISEASGPAPPPAG